MDAKCFYPIYYFFCPLTFCSETAEIKTQRFAVLIFNIMQLIPERYKAVSGLYINFFTVGIKISSAGKYQTYFVASLPMLFKCSFFIAVKLTQLIYVKIIAYYGVMEKIIVVMYLLSYIFSLNVIIKSILAHKMINFNVTNDKAICFYRCYDMYK